MRKTNLDKWNDLLEVLNSKKEKVLSQNLPERERPSILYRAKWQEIGEIPIESFGVRVYGEFGFYGKPTREDLKRMEGLIENFETLEKTLYVYYKEDHGTYKVSGGYKMEDIKRDPKLSFAKEDLEEIHKELHEKYAPRPGYKACSYCSKQVPEAEMVMGTIIFQNTRPDPGSRSGWKRFVDKKTNPYCSGTCAGNDQMAHEG